MTEQIAMQQYTQAIDANEASEALYWCEWLKSIWMAADRWSEQAEYTYNYLKENVSHSCTM